MNLKKEKNYKESLCRTYENCFLDSVIDYPAYRRETVI